jgi:tRNA pseudouridine55 synthase
MLGIALVDKPKGMSSHDAVYRARRALGIRKIGHAGTLDPNATGLLVMAVGEATRFLPYLHLEPKVYEGVAQLGITTTTQDVEGEVVARRPVGDVSLASVRQAVAALTGEIQQIPPMYSAVQVGGQRLYKLARSGHTVERSPRTVTVHEFMIDALADDKVTFRVVCSGGTYVRTLAHDLGEALGTGANLVSLRRTQIGEFEVAEAVSPEELTPCSIVPLIDALAPMPAIRLGGDAAERAKHGGEFTVSADTPSDYLALVDDAGVYAIAKRVEGACWRPERVLPNPLK